jgi:hypothetical protein
MCVCERGEMRRFFAPAAVANEIISREMEMMSFAAIARRRGAEWFSSIPLNYIKSKFTGARGIIERGLARSILHAESLFSSRLVCAIITTIIGERRRCAIFNGRVDAPRAHAAARNPPRCTKCLFSFSLILDAPAPFDSSHLSLSASRGPKENGEGPNAKNADSAAECA